MVVVGGLASASPLAEGRHYTPGILLIATQPPAANPPSVWLVNPYRAGEQSQVLALAEAVGWPFTVKHLAYRKLAARVNLLRGSDLSGIDPRHSDPLAPPWPDLIISAGMRNEPVCRWIRQQSGGRSRIVHLGRPWADPARFDLVITTPQYRLPTRDNVLHNALPLNRVNERQLAEARQRFAVRLEALPAPRIAVIVGGHSGPYTLGARAAHRLARQATALARELGGSLMITTSARTTAEASSALAAIREVPMHFYRWRPGDPDNPYFAYLELADRIVVTADSISMLSEACATGKPVHMFDLGSGRNSMKGDRGEPADEDFRLSALAYQGLMRWGWQRLSRDITLVHRQLLATGRASWLGEATASAVGTAPSDMTRAVARVRALMGRG